MGNSKEGARRGVSDPFWNTVASFGLEEVFVLPEWLEHLKGRKAEAPNGGSGGIEGELLDLAARVGDCRGCRLCEKRNSIVLGDGEPSAGILFVGEAPGASEDLEGRPFVGRAGKLLDRILAAIDLDRGSVYITNIVKCRPPGNRTPSPDEAEACGWILEEQVRIMKPGMIVSLGAPASRRMAGSTDGIGRLRGSVHRFGDIPVLATYHPAALLRTPAFRRPVWEDMKKLRKLLDDLGLPRGKSEG